MLLSAVQELNTTLTRNEAKLERFVKLTRAEQSEDGVSTGGLGKLRTGLVLIRTIQEDGLIDASEAQRLKADLIQERRDDASHLPKKRAEPDDSTEEKDSEKDSQSLQMAASAPKRPKTKPSGSETEKTPHDVSSNAVEDKRLKRI